MLVAHSPANKEIRELGSILHRCNLARGEMVHFVSNLSSFMMFEVPVRPDLDLNPHANFPRWLLVDRQETPKAKVAWSTGSKRPTSLS